MAQNLRSHDKHDNRDDAAEAAVTDAIKLIVSRGDRPSHLTVPDIATKILRQKSGDRINEGEARQRIGNAVAALVERGALKAGVQARKTWTILSEEKLGVPPNRIFIVHGRDTTNARIEVARFLERIGLEAVILHERPNKGRTIITKFQEEATNVAFAVVLMTPDDEGGLVGETPKKRARQNVVFELGFFIGKLGAANVVTLVQGGLERPSDFEGVVYVTYDSSGAWKRHLALELTEAKIEFDPAKLVGA